MGSGVLFTGAGGVHYGGGGGGGGSLWVEQVLSYGELSSVHGGFIMGRASAELWGVEFCSWGGGIQVHYGGGGGGVHYG